MALFASILFWVLIWVGRRNELESKWQWLAIFTWLLGLVVVALVPAARYLFMTLVATLDIALILAIFGSDIVIR